MRLIAGFYSIVQYMPDPGRLEAANVGVVLLCPDAGFLESRIVDGNDRVARFFGRASFDPVRLNSAKRALADRLRVERDRLLRTEEFERFIGTRANDIRLTPLRAIALTDPWAELEELFQELAGQRTSTLIRPRTRLGRLLKEIFEGPVLAPRIQRDAGVLVPITGEFLVAPYAFRNGRLNLIKPLYMNSRALTEARALALEGDLLLRHSREMEDPAALIVAVGHSAEIDAETSAVAIRLLREYRVQVYEESHLDDLRRRVEDETHG